MKKITKLLQMWSILVLFFLTTPAFAVSAEDAAATVSRVHNGRVLDVKSVLEQGRSIYLIKVITEDSRVMVVRVDAASGQILR